MKRERKACHLLLFSKGISWKFPVTLLLTSYSQILVSTPYLHSKQVFGKAVFGKHVDSQENQPRVSWKIGRRDAERELTVSDTANLKRCLLSSEIMPNH